MLSINKNKITMIMSANNYQNIKAKMYFNASRQIKV